MAVLISPNSDRRQIGSCHSDTTQFSPFRLQITDPFSSLPPMTIIPLRLYRFRIGVQRGWRQFATLKAVPQEDTGQNLTEKIVQRYAVDLPNAKIVRSGDYVSIKPEHCMSHDNCISLRVYIGNCSLAGCLEVPPYERNICLIPRFTGIGAKKILDNRQIVMTLDHDVQNKSQKVNLLKTELKCRI